MRRREELPPLKGFARRLMRLLKCLLPDSHVADVVGDLEKRHPGCGMGPAEYPAGVPQPVNRAVVEPLQGTLQARHPTQGGASLTLGS